MKTRTMILVLILAISTIIGCKIYQYNQPKYICLHLWTYEDGVSFGDFAEFTTYINGDGNYYLDYPEIYRMENRKKVGEIKFCFLKVLFIDVTYNPRDSTDTGLARYEVKGSSWEEYVF